LRVVRDRSGRINRQFPEPLPESEVTSTAKSVGTWTWRNITPAGLQALIERTHTPERQAERGRKATNQAQIAALGGIASGQARNLSREQERATARLLRARGYAQQQIADEIGVPRRTVSRWLS
jgi:DNA-directed RNA polymerase specialized sigma24 family protein